jgi:hypothetical protein
LSYNQFATTIIPHDASPYLMQQIIEQNLNLQKVVNRFESGAAGVGLVKVTRSNTDSQDGFIWTIMFTTAVGNIGQLNVTSFIKGIDAKIQIHTYQDGIK